MKLSEFVVSESILTDLVAGSKEEAIRGMVESLSRTGGIAPDDREGIISAILKREELGSTGIGRGVAVPHTKHPSVNKLVATIAISQGGVEFASLDGEDVHILFLLVSPPRERGRPPAGPRTDFPASAERQFLQFSAAIEDGRRSDRTARRVRQRAAVARTRRRATGPGSGLGHWRCVSRRGSAPQAWPGMRLQPAVLRGQGRVEGSFAPEWRGVPAGGCRGASGRCGLNGEL